MLPLCKKLYPSGKGGGLKSFELDPLDGLGVDDEDDELLPLEDDPLPEELEV